MRAPLAIRLRRAGIIHPLWTMRYALEHGVPLNVACAVLMQESGGGANEFGHDPTIFVGAGAVTRAKYMAYRVARNRLGECQGVGPMQLTSKGLQDEADVYGGCWLPRVNIAVGMHYLGELIGKHPDDLAAGVASYNGSGTAAQRYALHVLAIAAHFAGVIG